MIDFSNKSILVFNTVSSNRLDLFLTNLKSFGKYKDDNTIMIFHLNGGKKLVKELFSIVRIYIGLIFSGKKNNITAAGIFDGNIGKIPLFFLLGSITMFAVSGFSCLIVGKSLNVRKFDFSFPFYPLKNLVNIPSILRSYWSCFFKIMPGEILGFNRFHSMINLNYEIFKERMEKYGAWGYSYEDDFGSSLRSKFWLQWLSYGWLQGKFGQRWFSFVSAFLFLSSIVVVSFYSNKLSIGIIVTAFVPFSPYFLASFLTYTRPQCIVWFLAFPAFASVIIGNILILTFILFLISYLTFTGTFFIGLGVLTLILSQGKLFMMFAYIPVILKLMIDLFPLLQSGKFEVINQVGGRGDNKATKYRKNKRKFGILLYPNHLLISFNILVLLILAHFYSNPVFPIIFIYLLLLVVQFHLIRLTDLDTFYRLFLISCVSVAVFGNSIAEILIPMFMLYIKPTR